MKVHIEILSLATTGDSMKVRGQGKPKRSADWRAWDIWEFTVPEYVGRHYHIGQKLKIEVKP